MRCSLCEGKLCFVVLDVYGKSRLMRRRETTMFDMGPFAIRTGAGDLGECPAYAKGISQVGGQLEILVGGFPDADQPIALRHRVAVLVLPISIPFEFRVGALLVPSILCVGVRLLGWDTWVDDKERMGGKGEESQGSCVEEFFQ